MITEKAFKEPRASYNIIENKKNDRSARNRQNLKWKEILKACNKLKLGKAPGPEDIKPEQINEVSKKMRELGKPAST